MLCMYIFQKYKILSWGTWEKLLKYIDVRLVKRFLRTRSNINKPIHMLLAFIRLHDHMERWLSFRFTHPQPITVQLIFQFKKQAQM